MMQRLIIPVILLFISLASSGYADYNDSFVIKRADRKDATVSNPYDTLWKYSENGLTWSISNTGNQGLVFKKDYDTLAEGRFKGNKLTMRSSSGSLYLKIKITPDKIKVSRDTTADIWELKRKKDKIKVKLKGFDYGKISFYPETGKLKAKDRFAKVIVQIKPFNGLSFAPGAFLMSDLSEDQQIFIALLLFSKNT